VLAYASTKFLQAGFRRRVALALYFAFYNFCRIHKTLKVTPAMAAGITDKLWSLEDIANKIEERRPQATGKKRGAYKKRTRAARSQPGAEWDFPLYLWTP
jgi:hypothetical protein